MIALAVSLVPALEQMNLVACDCRAFDIQFGKFAVKRRVDRRQVDHTRQPRNMTGGIERKDGATLPVRPRAGPENKECAMRTVTVRGQERDRLGVRLPPFPLFRGVRKGLIVEQPDQPSGCAGIGPENAEVQFVVGDHIGQCPDADEPARGAQL